MVGVTEDKELLGYGCYDNAVARIIPRITSKVTTQMRTNITFATLRERQAPSAIYAIICQPTSQ